MGAEYKQYLRKAVFMGLIFIWPRTDLTKWETLTRCLWKEDTCWQSLTLQLPKASVRWKYMMAERLTSQRLIKKPKSTAFCRLDFCEADLPGQGTWYGQWEINLDHTYDGGATVRLRLWQVYCKQSDILYPYQKQNLVVIISINTVVGARIQWCLLAMWGMQD